MANIFKENKAVNEHPNRNNFDLSKKSNVSLKFGTLYPVYCQPVVPGDSFDINVAYNLKLMPVVFPVQTKMRAHMHFFYVRNKNLWSNWENWISNLPNATQSLTPHPYISLPDTEFKNGSIHDFLGVPTSVVGSIPFTRTWTPYNGAVLRNYYMQLSDSISDSIDFSEYDDASVSTWSRQYNVAVTYYAPTSGNYIDESGFRKLKRIYIPDYSNYFVRSSNSISLRFYVEDDVLSHQVFSKPFVIENYEYDANGLVIPQYIIDGVNHIFDELHLYDDTSDPDDPQIANPYISYIIVQQSVDEPDRGTIPTFGNMVLNSDDLAFLDYSELGADLYSNHLKINALPYRAYESCYWAYYNNNVVSPMTINGDVQYNRYNTNLGDGADTTNYHLFQRNYELDFLTSSLPSPQQGVAPLVGMTALGDVTIEDENGITTAHAEIDNDGTITKVVLTSPAASIEHARTAMNIAASGMSINDFRQTNALQRVLETNIRKGYRYMDFIAGHFGKEPEYRELDMPEFIGGFSRDVNVSTVVSQADTLGDDIGKALGSYGGYAQVVGGSNHPVRHYCDDYGFIIGILSVVPTPCYSQLLPKHMVAPDNFLDYYFPEFSQSGLMPITYKEVAPIQSYLDSLVDGTKSLEDTFGYQRPNYDMVSAVDEVHGEFRGALRDYVINRIFKHRPELGRNFLQINPSEINDIFVNTNPDDDTIIGEIGFAVNAKRPVPRVVIPNLGR